MDHERDEGVSSAPGRRAIKGAERLARDIVRRIYERNMQPGDKFLSEAEALNVFGVSRATLREALRYLQIQGVLRIRTGPGGGHFVGQPRADSLASTMALLLQFSGTPLRSIIDARRVLERALAREAAAHATPQDIARLDAELAGMAASVDHDEPFMTHYFAFLRAMVDAARNELFSLLLPALFEVGRSGNFGSVQYGRSAALELMRKLSGAIARHDAEKAVAIVDEMFLMIWEVLDDMNAELTRRVSWADVQDIL